MPDTPIERMLDAVDWKPVEHPADYVSPDGLPFATHTGILRIFDHELECVVLNTGIRLITAESIARLLGCNAEDLLPTTLPSPEAR
jgi:hypothetical protein